MPRAGRRTRSPRSGGDAGTGVVGTSLAVGLVLVLLLVGVQVLLHLVAASTVSGAAHDAARAVALAEPAPPAVAEQEARRRLGALGDSARFDWSGSDADRVVLQVEVDAAWRGRLPFVPERWARTVVVRREVMR